MKQNWLEGWALPGALAALNALVIGGWVRWLMLIADPAAAAPLPSLALMFGLVLSGTVTARLSLVGRWSINRARLAVLVIGALTLIGATAWLYGARFPDEYWRGLLTWGHVISREFLWLLAAPWLWWRGVENFHSRVPHETLEKTFWWGAVGLALALSANAGYPVLAASEVTGVTVIFFVVGVSALALMSLERARRRQKEATGSSVALNRHWLGTLIAVIGLTLVAGVALMELLTPGVIPVRDVIVAIWSPIALVLALILAVLAWPFFEWVERLPKLQFLPTPAPTPEGGFVQRPPLLTEEQMVATVTVADIVLIALLLILGVWLVLRRLRPPPPTDSNEVRESVFSRDLLMDQLRGWLSRFRSKPAPPPPYLTLKGDDPRLRIRRAYQSLLVWATLHNLNRSPSETPALFLHRLTRQETDRQSAVSALTHAYERARYGGEADTPTLAEATAAERVIGEITAERRAE